MATAELTSEATALLKAFAIMDDRHEVPTVHALSNIAGVTFMRTFDLINELFAAGLVTHDLKLTDKGRAAVG